MIVDARHHGLPCLHGLAQGLQHPWLKLGQLIEEQHAVMRQRHFTRLGAQAPAD